MLRLGHQARTIAPGGRPVSTASGRTRASRASPYYYAPTGTGTRRRRVHRRPFQDFTSGTRAPARLTDCATATQLLAVGHDTPASRSCWAIAFGLRTSDHAGDVEAPAGLIPSIPTATSTAMPAATRPRAHRRVIRRIARLSRRAAEGTEICTASWSHSYPQPFSDYGRPPPQPSVAAGRAQSWLRDLTVGTEHDRRSCSAPTV